MHSFSDFKKEHFLIAVDARVKLLAALALTVMVLTSADFGFPLFAAALSLAVCAGMKVPARMVLIRFLEPLLIALVLVMVKLLFSGSQPLFSFSVLGLAITGKLDGLMSGLMIAARMLGAVSVLITLGFATPFTEFIAGLAWFRVPRSFVEVLMFAYRYIFVLFEEASVIYQAQKNRLGYSSLKRGFSSFGTLSGSLTLKAFEHSQNTAAAMAQRGYEGDLPIYRHKPLSSAAIAGSFLFISVMAVLWKL